MIHKANTSNIGSLLSHTFRMNTSTIPGRGLLRHQPKRLIPMTYGTSRIYINTRQAWNQGLGRDSTPVVWVRGVSMVLEMMPSAWRSVTIMVVVVVRVDRKGEGENRAVARTLAGTENLFDT